ncbi:MarR family transcriptional regulator [Streptomyces sp. NPDC127110]|uniref:MarR family transcriptional regulator n=1 Tax=Streptomyces sp. NPDC127110 TaxID=3345362 RepID=UPI00363F1017
MTPEPPARKQRRPQEPVPPTADRDSDPLFQDVVALLAQKMGQTPDIATPAPQPGARKQVGRKVKQIRIDFENAQPTTIHDMAGGSYSITSNWFSQLVGQLIIANEITRSQIAVFMYVAGGQELGTGVTAYTQQEITDGLNREAAKKPGAKLITRPTVNRAVKALCDFGWLEPAGYGRIQLNVRLWFAGNSEKQRAVLHEIAAQHNHDPDKFPYRIGPEGAGVQQMLDLPGLEAPHAEEHTDAGREATG